MHRLQDLIRLHRQGEGSRVIARQLRMGRDTIRHYVRALSAAALLDGEADELPELDVLSARSRRRCRRGRHRSSPRRWKAGAS
jgi:hypothetical protein